MVECSDPRLMEKYMKKYGIREKFSTPDLPFRLYRYEVGEMMNVLHPQEQYLKFLVSGCVAVEKIESDGTTKLLFEEKAFSFFGEAEICGHSFSDHSHEVLETAYCIELPLEPFRKILWSDIKFMQYLVTRMSESIFYATFAFETFSDDTETRLLKYIQNCPGQTVSGMELTAKRLRCSRRQLQRIVSKLVDEGTLAKSGWGTYSFKHR